MNVKPQQTTKSNDMNTLNSTKTSNLTNDMSGTGKQHSSNTLQTTPILEQNTTTSSKSIKPKEQSSQSHETTTNSNQSVVNNHSSHNSIITDST